MNVLLYARSPSNTPQEVQRQWEASRRFLHAEDATADTFYDLGPSGPAHNPALALALTRLSAGEVEEIYSLSPDRLARTRPELEALQILRDRHGLALKLEDEDSGDLREGGR